MKQALHIFRKDVRFLWHPILVVLALTAVFAWIHAYSEPEEFEGIISFFLVVGWVYLVVAAVHQEPPTGERQFWVTRPYAWTSLVTAKILFIALFVNLPFLLSDVAILSAQWLPITVRSLMLRQITFTAAFLVPAAALAAITRHYAEFALTLFAALLAAVFGVGYLSGAPQQWGELQWIPASALGCILFLFGAGVLFSQYAMRRMWIGRGALIATACLCVSILAIPPSDLAVSLAGYRAGRLELQMVHLDTLMDGTPYVPSWSGVNVVNAPPGMLPAVDLVDATFQDPGKSFRWSSGWTRNPDGDSSYIALDGEIGMNEALRLSRRFKHLPADMKYSVAMTLYRASEPMALSLKGQPAEIPGIGYCNFAGEGYLSTPTIRCRSVRFPSERVRVNGFTVIGEPRGYRVFTDLSPVSQEIRGFLPMPREFLLTVEHPDSRIRRDLELKVQVGAQ